MFRRLIPATISCIGERSHDATWRVSVSRQQDVQIKHSAAQHLHMRKVAAIGQITKLAGFRLFALGHGLLVLYGCWRPVSSVWRSIIQSDTDGQETANR